MYNIFSKKKLWVVTPLNTSFFKVGGQDSVEGQEHSIIKLVSCVKTEVIGYKMQSRLKTEDLSVRALATSLMCIELHIITMEITRVLRCRACHVWKKICNVTQES